VSGPGGPVPLPSQPEGRSWPTLTWATAEVDGDADRLDSLLDAAFRHNPNPELALSLACVVVQAGRVVAERYGPATRSLTPLISWSMGKSILQAAVGIAVADGLLDLDATDVAPEWSGAEDPRREITIRQLLAMRDGLDFSEDYVDATASHCIEMLFGQGADDVAGYAASRPSAASPGERFNYSSGTTNIISRALTDALVGRGEHDPDRRRVATGDFLQERLFGPIGMTAEPRYDAAGTWVASSYVYASARDFARFGLLYLRDGRWDGARILPEGWVDVARTWVSTDPEDGLGYGAQWWLYDDGLGTFAAKGYEGQSILCVPASDLVVVRLGKTPIEHRPALEAWYAGLIDCFQG
jgi:CubicO group peptidase (beta-lactamase class C family)